MKWEGVRGGEWRCAGYICGVHVDDVKRSVWSRGGNECVWILHLIAVLQANLAVSCNVMRCVCVTSH